MLDPGLEPRTMFVGCHAGCQEVSRCCTRGKSEDSVAGRLQSNLLTLRHYTVWKQLLCGVACSLKEKPLNTKRF